MALITEYEPEATTLPPNGRHEDGWPALSQSGGTCSRLSRDEQSELRAPQLQVRLLGGFRVERAGADRLASDWPRRSAKTLTKVLATCPGHTLHREQLIEILWPGVDLDSALNSFGKALHAARHALEPELPPRGCSRYLRLTDGMLALDTQSIAVDADRFERLAEHALRQREIDAYETALAAYAGELLPEDRYEDWCAERRASLSELRIRLLLGLADALEGREAYIESADRLRQVVVEDPTREEVHRRLMRLWVEIGNRDQAVRQFHICQEALSRELKLMPQRETVALYQAVLAGRLPTRSTRRKREEVVSLSHRTVAKRSSAPLTGREQVLEDLLARLERQDGRPPMLLLTGEAGVGKTRVLETLATEASRVGTVLWGEVGAHVSHLPCGPVAVALEGFVASRSEGDRRNLARQYPVLAHLVPSLAVDPPAPLHEKDRIEHLEFLLAIVRALSDLAIVRPLLFAVDDLHEADPLSLEVLRYFAHLGRQRRWLFVAAVRDEELQADSAVARTLESMLREGLCGKLELPCLSHAEGHELVCALSGDERIDDEVARQICARSGGNPLFIEALAEQALEHREPRSTDGSRTLPSLLRTEVPPRIRLLVNSQLRALDGSVRRVLALAAAAETAEIALNRLLAAAAALESPIGPAVLFDALDRALSVRILEEREGGYAFRHPLVRSVLFQELSTHRREELRAALCRPNAERGRQLRVTASQ